MEKPNIDIQEILPLLSAQDMRIDYNFNTIINLSILIEFLYNKLNESDLKIDLDSGFEEFQKERLEEIQKSISEIDAEAVKGQAKDLEEQLKAEMPDLSNIKL